MSVPCQFFFRSADGYGWSERYFYAGTTTDPAFSSNINALASARVQLLTTSGRLTHIRVASPTLRNPFIFALAAGGTPGSYAPPTAPAEVALLFRMNAGITGYNRIFLRGIPDEIVSGDSYAPTPTWNGVMNSFIATLSNSFWNCQGTLGSPTVRFPILNLNPNLPRGYSFDVTPRVLVQGNVIRMHGASVPGYNGIKRVVAVGPSATLVQVGGAAPAVADPTTLAYYTQIMDFDAVITSAFPENLTRRAAGRPFGLSRGRRPTLYSLRR